ncbi:hypothetical protein TVAG_106080 [Trichomonas vaginalis G3]|uniref:Uncharacterized protein n=1 Tax=Trichomonas vaginalis (strain ATCC PRA-98 / G3) TaxID=412133 RepID=A2GV42_TRIV3|nr:hypothetical protein TVAG_106080 [Trichomonas vaginalis G3]|eukprot:XP_001291905.1 hypothetical protein [Trichomonas vaginalis G3]
MPQKRQKEPNRFIPNGFNFQIPNNQPQRIFQIPPQHQQPQQRPPPQHQPPQRRRTFTPEERNFNNLMRQQNQGLRFYPGSNGIHIRHPNLDRRYTAEIHILPNNTVNFAGFYDHHQEIWTPPFDTVLEGGTVNDAIQYINNGFDTMIQRGGHH